MPVRPASLGPGMQKLFEWMIGGLRGFVHSQELAGNRNRARGPAI